MAAARGGRDEAAEIVARETPLWRAWIHERFPMPTGGDLAAESAAGAGSTSTLTLPPA